MSAADRRTLLLDAAAFGHRMTGFHNENYVIDLSAHAATLLGLDPGTPVKVRVPLDPTLKVVERAWADEGVLLDALHRTPQVSGTPRCHAGLEGFSVQEYIPGLALSELCASGKPVDPLVVDAIVDQLARFTEVVAADLPLLPPDWCADGDSLGFLRARVDFVERKVRAANWAEYGGLFASLEVPANALRWFRDRIPPLRPRPFGLLHADLHRHNVIVRDDGGITLVDWELAMWGDPLHDLAIHVVRMRYPAHQQPEVIHRWQQAVGRVRPEAAAGLERDLPVYVAYERAQSLFADTLRVAHSLGAHPEPGLVGEGVSRVRAALHVAAGPLRLRRVPARAEVERALVGWVRRRAAAERMGDDRTDQAA